MAHNIEYNEQKGSHSFVSKKEIAWHRLGKVVEEAMTSKEALELANLNYEVIKVPTFAQFPIKDVGEGFVQDMTGRLHPKDRVPTRYKGSKVPDKFATVRTDNATVLGGVGSRYEVVQNTEAFDFIDSIIGKNKAMYETAGVLGNGETIFVTARFPDYIRIEGTEDIIKNYILFTNNHTGEGEVVAMMTPTRVVCNNTLNMALNSTSKSKVSFRHTKNVRDKLSKAMKVMGLYNTYTKDLNLILNEAKKYMITESIEDKYIQSILLTKDEIEFVEANNGNILTVDEVSSRKKNQFIDVKTYTERGVGQDMHKGTALWLFNGVNGYLYNYKNYKDDERKLTSVVDGESYKTNQRAYNSMVELIDGMN